MFYNFFLINLLFKSFEHVIVGLIETVNFAQLVFEIMKSHPHFLFYFFTN